MFRVINNKIDFNQYDERILRQSEFCLPSIGLKPM